MPHLAGKSAWTWQRDTELSDDELYALSEELTLIRSSPAKLQALASLSENIPSASPVAAVVVEEKLERSAPSDENLADFQRQERKRYTFAPSQPFMYEDRRTGQQVVVGPALRPGPGGDRKMRDHPLLVLERPAHVNLKNLVIDAVARLENHVGTRAQVCEKFKDSQYLKDSVTEQQISTCVGGALDRMQAEKWDPAVTYDMNRKLWVYLHHDRTLENWKEKAKGLQLAKRQSVESDAKTESVAAEPEAKQAKPAPPQSPHGDNVAPEEPETKDTNSGLIPEPGPPQPGMPLQPGPQPGAPQPGPQQDFQLGASHDFQPGIPQPGAPHATHDFQPGIPQPGPQSDLQPGIPFQPGILFQPGPSV